MQQSKNAIMTNWTPMQWPKEWKNPATLEFLKSTPFNFLLMDEGDEFEAVRAAAKARGIEVGARKALPDGVQIVKGEWPGVRTSASGGDSASAGPTGEPWVNTNSWRVAIERARSVGASVWVDGPPRANAVMSSAGYRTAVADSAAAGGRWILALNDPLAQGITAGNVHALETWKAAAATTEFFAGQADWAGWKMLGTIGVISDFAGKNALVGEVVNLIGRAGSHFRVMLKTAATFDGIRAVVYADADAPDAQLRKGILEFVKGGGTLITTPVWGKVEGAPQAGARMGYQSFVYGKGRIEVADKKLADPYTFAHDAVVIVSRRYDLVRLWNGGASNTYLNASPDGKRVLAQMLVYWDEAATEATIWVAGKYRSAKLYTIEGPAVTVDFTAKASGAEIHLPPVRQYAAVELERI